MPLYLSSLCVSVCGFSTLSLGFCVCLSLFTLCDCIYLCVFPLSKHSISLSVTPVRLNLCFCPSALLCLCHNSLLFSLSEMSTPPSFSPFILLCVRSPIHRLMLFASMTHDRVHRPAYSRPHVHPSISPSFHPSCDAGPSVHTSTGPWSGHCMRAAGIYLPTWHNSHRWKNAGGLDPTWQKIARRSCYDVIDIENQYDRRTAVARVRSTPDVRMRSLCYIRRLVGKQTTGRREKNIIISI